VTFRTTATLRHVAVLSVLAYHFEHDNQTAKLAEYGEVFQQFEPSQQNEKGESISLDSIVVRDALHSWEFIWNRPVNFRFPFDQHRVKDDHHHGQLSKDSGETRSGVIP